MRISFGTGGLRAAATARALRDGRYEAHPEMRLRDDGTPRLLDLCPRDQIRAEDGSVPTATEIPLIRLRSFCPVLPDFDAIAAATAVYDALADRTETDEEHDGTQPLPSRVMAMFAAYALSETPEMRALASEDENVCATSAPTPWSPAHALVLRRPKSGGYVPLLSTPIDHAISGLFAPCVSVGDAGRTMDGTRIDVIHADFVHCPARDVPTTIDAMRTLASMLPQATAA